VLALMLARLKRLLLPGLVKSQNSSVATAAGLVCGQPAKGSVA
jgi:hypothetical protein